MMKMVTVEELDARLRVVESEVSGEKAVTRYLLEQTRLNGDELSAIKTQVRHLTENMTVANAALQSQGTLLNVLRQDVTTLRQEVGHIRADMVELRQEINRKLDTIVAALPPREHDI